MSDNKISLQLMHHNVIDPSVALVDSSSLRRKIQTKINDISPNNVAQNTTQQFSTKEQHINACQNILNKIKVYEKPIWIQFQNSNIPKLTQIQQSHSKKIDQIQLNISLLITSDVQESYDFRTVNSNWLIFLRLLNVFKSLKGLIVVLIILLSSYQVQSIGSSTPLPTMYYQTPWLQTGYQSFLPSDDNYFSGTIYKSNFIVTFKRVYIQSKKNRIIISTRDLSFILQSGIFGIQHYLSNEILVTHTGFNFTLRLSNQAELITWRLNYLAVSMKLTASSDIIITNPISTMFIQGASWPTSTTTVVNRQYWRYIRSSPIVPISAVADYKIFCSIVEYSINFPNNLTVPHVYYTAQILTTTTFGINVEINNFSPSGSIFTFVAFLIRASLFDITQRYQVMFSNLPIVLNTTLPSGEGFDLTLNHMAADINVFVLFYGFQANPIEFTIMENLPVDNVFKANMLKPGVYKGQLLAFYGYTKYCPTYYMQMDCQPCPVGCGKCHVYPSFHCIYCQINFVQINNMTCDCPFPLNIASNLCDNFSPGCISGQRLANGTARCTFCDISLGLSLNLNNQCECKIGYERNATISNSSCQQICGDGLLFEKQCDDGNLISADGCSSTCTLEPGFDYDMSTTPPTLKSSIFLQYEIKEILRDQFINSATLKLKHKYSFALPLPVKDVNFIPLSKYIKLKIIVSKYPFKQTEYVITQITVNQDNQISLKFDYDFTIENLNASLTLNYQKTQYKNESQIFQFQLKGKNKPLRFQSNMATFKALGQSLMVGSISNVLCLLIGLLSPKFIGLESISTLQLIYYSQLLIYNVSQWPAGFVFLKYLKIAGGYNDIFQFTQYFMSGSMSKKMTNLFIKKLIIQNFNINAIILISCSILLCVFTGLRYVQQKFLAKSIKQKMQVIKLNDQWKSFDQKIETEKLKLLNRLNQVFFWVGSQVIFWLLLPIVCTIGSYLLIPNLTFQFITASESNSWSIRLEGIIVFLSLFFIFAIGSNHFCNFWLGLFSLNKLLERPQEITYKRTLFIYLLIQGSLIFFFNDFAFGPLYTSVLVMLIHLIYILLLLKINPYKQSLRVHTICLLFNQGVFLGFILVINLINFIENIPSLIILILGYFVTICCAISIILTMVRLYYELRYGPALQEQVQEERRKQKEEERLRKQRLLKRKQDELEEQAKLKISQKEQIRQKNDFLFENQVNEENKIELLKWLQSRKWDQKTKQIYYFKHFAQKPLKWLRQNDNKKYSQKLKLIEDIKQERVLKKTQISTDPEYLATVKRLKTQLKEMKRMKINFNKQTQ